VVWEGLLEDSLEVVCRRPRLALAVVCVSLCVALAPDLLDA
jgi:hypothetical protein